MALSVIDIAVFVLFMLLVVGVSLWAGRKERGSEDYFLAGRSLGWGLIGFSLIASNISTEHFVGMAGSGFGRLGMAIASYEWIAAVSLVVVALWLLPKFLKAGIYTMPEFLEYRYDGTTRTIMSSYLMALTVIAVLVTVLYSGAQGLNGVFGFPAMFEAWFGLEREQAVFWATWAGGWAIGIVAAAYTIYGGLKAVVWSDLIQGGALVLGGAIVLYLGLKIVGGGQLADGGGITGGNVIDGAQNFWETNRGKLHTLLPASDPEMPWVAVLIGGLWIPNLFYWGLNQFITQRTLGAKSLAEGQKGVFLAAFIKILLPFLIVFPGIIAWQVFGDDILASVGGDTAKAGEQAYPFLIAKLMPDILRGIMLAALAGAVMSTFNSGINSASTMFTIDIYTRLVRPDATPKDQVRVGRITTALIALAACLMAPLPGLFSGVFSYIQEVWGFISPAIVACFFFGLLVRRAPPVVGKLALVLGPVLYGAFRVPKWIMEGVFRFARVPDENGVFVPVRMLPEGGSEPLTGLVGGTYRFLAWPFLHHMLIVFGILIAIMTVVTMLRPAEPKTLPESRLDVKPWRFRYLAGGLVVASVAGLYVVFA